VANASGRSSIIRLYIWINVGYSLRSWDSQCLWPERASLILSVNFCENKRASNGNSLDKAYFGLVSKFVIIYYLSSLLTFKALFGFLISTAFLVIKIQNKLGYPCFKF